MNKYLLLFLAAGIFTVGCKKNDDMHDEEYNPTITITSPADSEMGTVGQEMSIEADIDREDSKFIHNVTVQIVETSTGIVVENLIDNVHVHTEGHYDINDTFTPSAPGTYFLLVLTTDHEDPTKQVSETQVFTVMDASYDVTIDIHDPVESSILAVNDDLAVKVVYTHDYGGIIHHVRIEVQDDNGNVVATLIDGHQHVEGTYTFESTDAYTADSAGTFKIVARTMNMDMSIMQMAERTFTVQ